jgi:serine/threonine protein kinase
MLTHKELKDRVPTLICGGDVVVGGFKDSTQRYRGARCTHRIHRRIVTSPVGEPITSFKTKKEFIQVLINVIESKLTYLGSENLQTMVYSPPLDNLHNHVRILHCDLSPNNILINRKNANSEAVGLLIDYDYSVDIEQTPHHTVTRDCAPGSVVAARVPAVSDPKFLMAQTRPTFRTVCLFIHLKCTSIHYLPTRVLHPLWPLRPFLQLIKLSSTSPNMTLNQSFTLFFISAHWFVVPVYHCSSWTQLIMCLHLYAPGSVMMP